MFYTYPVYIIEKYLILSIFNLDKKVKIWYYLHNQVNPDNKILIGGENATRCCL